MAWYQNLPLHIDPIAFTVGSFSVRWYALSYIAAFGLVYWLLALRAKKGELPAAVSPDRADETIVDFLLVSFFSALIGGRLGYVLFYDLPYFLAHPSAAVSPYDFASGKFVGFYGMSYHGALVGVLVGGWIFARAKKIDFWQWADFVAPAAAMGYFFGRVGNFLNGELYGRITSLPLGMHFAGDPSALRHPSQLYEAVLEGLLLFAILWRMRKMKMPAGTLLAAYLAGYGFFRILAENFRQPDPQIGLLWGYFTLGQLLSFAMVIAGVSILVFKKPGK